MAAPTIPESKGSVPPALPHQHQTFLSSSVGTKVLVAITGILLIVYLVVHLAGNLLIFLGPDTFNSYSAFLLQSPIVTPIELVLLAIFLVHVYKAITNYIRNRNARPVRYHQPIKRIFGWGWAGRPSRKSLSSTTMIGSGILLFLFIIVHLRQFKFGTEYVIATTNQVEIRDLYRLEAELFSNPLIVGFYVVSMVVVGSHLWHGFSSAINSLGIDHPKYTPWILRFSQAFAIVIGGGFLLIPPLMYIVGSR